MRPSGLPGTIQSSAGEDFSSFFRWHEPNPAFRTKRRRKGFESVRRSGVTAKGFRADCKRRALFFTNSRLWLGAKGRRLWWKRASLGGDKKGLVQMDGFWFAKKGYILSPCKATRKRKAFLSSPQHQLRTTPKLTCSYKFYPRNPTVSLQYNNPFSKLRNLASAVQLPFRTDSNPHRRYPGSLQSPARLVT